jgi:hypothetical protein
MKRAKFILTILIMLWTVHENFAQSPQKDKADSLIYQQEREFEKQEAALRSLASKQSFYVIKKWEKPLSKEELKIEEKRIKDLIAPHPEDLEKHKNFLLLPRTGLFRLFPDFDCEEKYIVRTGGNCENFIPGTSTYSFRQKDYQLQTPLKFYDIKLKGGDLVSREFLSQGILTELGDVQLESITLDSNGIKFLNDFKPESKNSEVKKQFLQIANSIPSGGYIYTKSLAAKENMTYALRIIAYRVPWNLSQRNELKDIRIRALAEGWVSEKRDDLTIAFRIIRKETDGNITILWKELRRQKPPIMNGF